jgi:hypothetical protein
VPAVRYSVCLIYWYNSTNTDSNRQQGTRATAAGYSGETVEWRQLPLPTIPAFLSTFVDMYTITLRPLRHAGQESGGARDRGGGGRGGHALGGGAGEVTIQVSARSTCRQVFSLLALLVQKYEY